MGYLHICLYTWQVKAYVSRGSSNGESSFCIVTRHQESWPWLLIPRFMKGTNACQARCLIGEKKTHRVDGVFDYYPAHTLRLR